MLYKRIYTNCFLIIFDVTICFNNRPIPEITPKIIGFSVIELVIVPTVIKPVDLIFYN